MNDLAQGLYQRLQAYDLDQADPNYSFTRRLIDENHWSALYTQRVCQEYKKFVWLAIMSEQIVTPSSAIDQVWHLHLLHSREYWQHFCPHILAQELHHQPARIDKQQREFYQQTYANTLKLYQQVFQQLPPEDIWFPIELDFNANSSNITTNSSSLGLKFKTFLTAISLLLLNSCTDQKSEFILFSLPPEIFLTNYMIGGFILLLIARSMIPKWVLPIVNKPINNQLAIDKLAYLIGGHQRVIMVSLIHLLDCQIIRHNPEIHKFEWLKDQTNLTKIEQYIVAELKIYQSLTLNQLLVKCKPIVTDDIRLELEQKQYLLSQKQLKSIRLYAGLGFLPLFSIGLLRLIHGISLQHPVGYLILLMGLTILTPFFISPFNHKTLYGKQVARFYQRHYRELKHRSVLLDSVAILGGVALTNTAFADIGQELSKYYQHNSADSSTTSGGDGSSCSSGCGGGSGCGG